FVHLIRNPYDLYYSTIKLHNHNTEIYAMQKQTYNLEKIILENYNIMYEKFYEEVDLIPEGNLVNVRFEDLRDNPLEQLEKIYATLNLENFEKAKQQVLPYLLSVANYKPSSYQITKKDKKMIDSHWHDTIVKWGYEKV
ncbi:MAG: sulfotransferase, partial [Candidatus Heimdallarchaeaceae archaeon]